LNKNYKKKKDLQVSEVYIDTDINKPKFKDSISAMGRGGPGTNFFKHSNHLDKIDQSIAIKLAYEWKNIYRCLMK
jgi:hypothetical protein